MKKYETAVLCQTFYNVLSMLTCKQCNEVTAPLSLAFSQPSLCYTMPRKQKEKPWENKGNGNKGKSKKRSGIPRKHGALDENGKDLFGSKVRIILQLTIISQEHQTFLIMLK